AAAAPPASADAHRIQVVLNPAARSGAAAAVREAVARELEARGGAWTRVDTSGAGDAVQRARRGAVHGVPVRVAAGGDGTARGAAAAVREEVARELEARGVAWTRVDTSGPGDAVEIARRAALNGVPVVVAVGGDGTVHEVANGLLRARAEREHDTALGIIPCGT